MIWSTLSRALPADFGVHTAGGALLSPLTRPFEWPFSVSVTIFLLTSSYRKNIGQRRRPSIVCRLYLSIALRPASVYVHNSELYKRELCKCPNGCGPLPAVLQSSHEWLRPKETDCERG